MWVTLTVGSPPFILFPLITDKEIETVIKNFSTSKTPRPHGSSGEFFHFKKLRQNQYMTFRYRCSGLPRWHSGKESSCQCRRRRFDPWVRKFPLGKEMASPPPVFLPGKFHGQQSLSDCSPWGPKESSSTEQQRLSTHTHKQAHTTTDIQHSNSIFDTTKI